MVFSNKEIKYRYQKIFNGNEKLRIGVAVALINLENQVLLEKRSDCGWWGVTGGGLNKGENIETKLIKKSNRLLLIKPCPSPYPCPMYSLDKLFLTGS